MKFISILIFFLSVIYSQNGKHWYYNIDKENIAILGYDPVSYFNSKQASVGRKDIEVIHNDVRYLFSSIENRDKFKESPDDYLPQYGGWCAFTMGIDKKKYRSAQRRSKPDPQNFKIINDKLYLFFKAANFDAKQHFESNDQAEYLKRADAFWQTRVNYGKRYPKKPEGLAVEARMENLDWQPLIGSWEGKNRWLVSLEPRQYGAYQNGVWTFQYDYKGYCIKDDFYYDNAEWAGPATRVYDAIAEEWTMIYIPLIQPQTQRWTMTGKFVDGELHGSFKSKDAQGREFLQKIYFYDIKENSFKWRADRSYDEGKTWIKNLAELEMTRI